MADAQAAHRWQADGGRMEGRPGYAWPGTPSNATPMSRVPSLPKPGSGLPVPAFNATILFDVVNRIRGGLFLSPGQYATPRRIRTTPARRHGRRSGNPFTSSSDRAHGAHRSDLEVATGSFTSPPPFQSGRLSFGFYRRVFRSGLLPPVPDCRQLWQPSL